MPSPQPSSKPVSAIVEPGLSPPPVPLLSSHVGLLSNATVILCSRKDLLFFLTTPLPSHQSAHCPIPAVVRATTPHHPVPEGSLSHSTEDEDDAMSDTTSSGSSLTFLESMSNKIPKPEGEPGRPGRGGYNLEAQLAWDSTKFSRLKKFVHRSIKKHLDTTKCRSLQSKEAIQLVIQEASKVFPDLEDYFACWPVRDVIQMRLKYTSGRARMSQRMGARKRKEVD